MGSLLRVHQYVRTHFFEFFRFIRKFLEILILYLSEKHWKLIQLKKTISSLPNFLIYHKSTQHFYLSILFNLLASFTLFNPNFQLSPAKSISISVLLIFLWNHTLIFNLPQLPQGHLQTPFIIHIRFLTLHP